MKKILLAMFCIFILTTICRGQTIEKLAKEGASSICNCLEKIDYIDGPIDLEIKMNGCSQLTHEDTVKINKIARMHKYDYIMFTELFSNCTLIKAKMREWQESSKLGLSDSIYASEKKYGKVQRKIIGQYSLLFGHSSHEGGGAYLNITKPDRYLIITTFGDYQAGTWKIVKGKYLHLIPDKPKYPFTVYGRYNASIGDSTRITLEGRDFSYATLIHFGEINEISPILTPIYNEDVNCLSYSYRGKTIENKYSEISLAYNPHYKDIENPELNIYTFKKTKAFNDFIIYEDAKNSASVTLKVIIDDDKLLFGENEITERQPLPKNTSEDGELIKELIKVKEISQYVFYDLDYRKFTSETLKSEYYFFNEDLDAYISVHNYQDGRCDTLRVNRFELLQDITQDRKQFKIDENSFIYSICD